MTTGWHDNNSALEQWIEAPAEPEALDALLEAAREQCEAYAPALPEDAVVPVRYRQAQLMQARALWQSMSANANDSINDGTFSVALYPMDKTIRNLLRPRLGVPIVG